MKFKPTSYKLMNVSDGRIFEDEGWTLADPEGKEPSLVRAVYENEQFVPREDLKGLYRYANWLPIKRTLKRSYAPVTYRSKGLGDLLGLENLYITVSGYVPKHGVKMETCSFKETEAFSICARLPKNNDRILVVQSAGNTARAFARVCSDNNIPIVICIPNDNINDLWFLRKLKPCVKIIATPNGTDYYDAIALGEKLCKDPRYMAEGGAKNVARRDGMGTTLLSAVEKIGRIPDAYFQAVGSGTGAIAAWENAERLAKDGRFGENKMRVYCVQNAPFTLIADSWKAGSRELVSLSPEVGRRNAEMVLAKVLANRKPPYSLAGGLYDVLTASNGACLTCSNDELLYSMLLFRNLEGYDLLPAACCAVSSLINAVHSGLVKKDEFIMLNCTGGGSMASMSMGYKQKEPDLIVSPDVDEDELIRDVNRLF